MASGGSRARPPLGGQQGGAGASAESAVARHPGTDPPPGVPGRTLMGRATRAVAEILPHR